MTDLIANTKLLTEQKYNDSGSSFAASCMRNLLPGSAPISLQWFSLYLSFSNIYKATTVTHTKRIDRNLLRKETSFVCYTFSVLRKSRHMKQKEKITHCCQDQNSKLLKFKITKIFFKNLRLLKLKITKNLANCNSTLPLNEAEDNYLHRLITNLLPVTHPTADTVYHKRFFVSSNKQNYQ